MTREELNTAINTVFDDARADNSLAPSMEGSVIKLVADYLDQEVSNATGIGYKVYSAFLQFLDGSITPTVLANTIGDGSGDGVNDIAWSYNTPTEPKAVMTDAPFISGKCVYIPTMYFQSNTAFSLKGTRITDSEFRLFSAVITTGNSALAFTSGVYVEIRIYN